ncbi:hypothetical protein [Flagellimonas okinawensis]|uniref:Lipocalin-like domain-containing protein n=1 Tax=Flagellimonas okinawensis TaxID=3031324 RepID=A0ABT5XRW9_9FLAO|nr:hypothetical protein [[Muricauda] okinawensis]MDF0708647.1 hypothetical protein [[Muricauda] okinawensis]
MTKGFYLLLLLSAVLTSCSGDDTIAGASENDLMGSWVRTDDQQDGSIVTTYSFHGDLTYRYTTEWFGFNGEPKTVMTSFSRTNGLFDVEGDSLFLQSLEYQGGFNAKFSIFDDVLYLEYITYPADAPVITKLNYHKVD